VKIVVVVLCLSLFAPVFVTADDLPVNPQPAQSKPKTKRLFLGLSGAVYGAALMDMHRTMEWRDAYRQVGAPFYSRYEGDPLARPIIKLPKPAYYATGLALATGVNYLSWRMQKSRHFQKVWFVPQLLAVAGNSYGYASTWHK